MSSSMATTNVFVLMRERASLRSPSVALRLSNHAKQVIGVQRKKIRTQKALPGVPRGRGRIERFFQPSLSFFYVHFLDMRLPAEP
jgi:hypothetical protein